MPPGPKFRSATGAFWGKRYFWRHFCTMAFFQDLTLLIFDIFLATVPAAPSVQKGVRSGGTPGLI